jgi:hypothetical protein
MKLETRAYNMKLEVTRAHNMKLEATRAHNMKLETRGYNVKLETTAYKMKLETRAAYRMKLETTRGRGRQRRRWIKGATTAEDSTTSKRPKTPYQENQSLWGLQRLTAKCSSSQKKETYS